MYNSLIEELLKVFVCGLIGFAQTLGSNCIRHSLSSEPISTSSSLTRDKLISGKLMKTIIYFI